MTPEQQREALELMHKLWGRHASGDYEKSIDKKLWARLDDLIRGRG